MYLGKSYMSAQLNSSTVHSTSHVYSWEDINSLAFVCNFAFSTNFDIILMLDDLVIELRSYYTRVIKHLNLAR